MSDKWKKLMTNAPKERNIPKFSSEHIKVIEQAAYQCNRTAAEIFLDEWSTMGRNRPTLETLLKLLVKAELFRAADYVACDILKQERPKRPNSGPAAPVDISDAAIKKLLEEQQMLQDTKITDSVLLESTEQEIHKMYLEDKTVDDLAEVIDENLPDSITSLNYGTTADVPPEIISDLIKFSATDTCEVKNDHVAHTSAVIQPEQWLPTIDEKERNRSEDLLTGQFYQEISSQELPVFLNNSSQSAMSNKEVPSEYLPVFRNSPAQSTISNEEMSSSDLPLCLKR